MEEVVIALAGNPNVGKSTLFNAVTGLKQHTGNWAGKTVEVKSGRYKNFVLVDLPGTYSLVAHSAEEEVAREFICSGKADRTVVVCDGVSLERSLILVLQVLDITPYVTVCINLSDEAEKKGIKTDVKKLSEILGVPVVTASAKKKKGIYETIETVPCGNSFKMKYSEGADEETAARELVEKAQEIAAEVVSFENSDYALRDRRTDRILTGKFTGIPVMLLLLALILWLTISGANYPSALLSNLFEWFGGVLENLFTTIKMPPLIKSAILDGVYGVLTSVVSVMLPPMAIFFPLFTILEDLGYLPRVAFNLDSHFKKACACGKQSLTMCMGLGCNAVGVSGCRIIDSPRERLIAILTNNFMPCNGRFPALIAIITMFVAGGAGLSAAVLTLIITVGVIITFGVSWMLSKTILRGSPSSFTLELPPYRTPNVGQVIIRSVLDRTLFVLGRAVSVAAPAGLVIWLLANINIGEVSVLTYCCDFLDPFGKIIGLDGVILFAFILGIPANEIVLPIMLMAYTGGGKLLDGVSIAAMREILVSNGWTVLTGINVMLFSLLHWPCSTTLLTVKKETGSVKWMLLAFVIPTAVAFLVCGAVNAAGFIVGWNGN